MQFRGISLSTSSVWGILLTLVLNNSPQPDRLVSKIKFQNHKQDLERAILVLIT